MTEQEARCAYRLAKSSVWQHVHAVVFPVKLIPVADLHLCCKPETQITYLFIGLSRLYAEQTSSDGSLYPSMSGRAVLKASFLKVVLGVLAPQAIHAC